MTKKLIISSLFLALMALPGVQISHAQTVDTPATSAQVDALQQTLIKLLTEMIAQLQAQITEILAQQAQTQTTVTAIEQKVNQPVLGSQSPAQVIPLKVDYLDFYGDNTYFAVLASLAKGDTVNLDADSRLNYVDGTITSITTNKAIDPTRTEVWINGVKKDIATDKIKKSANYESDCKTRKSCHLSFVIVPSIYKMIPETQTNIFNADIEVKIYSEDGSEVVSRKYKYHQKLNEGGSPTAFYPLQQI